MKPENFKPFPGFIMDYFILCKALGNRCKKDLAGAAVDIHQAFAGCCGANQGLTGTFNGKVQSTAPCDGKVAVDLQNIVIQLDLDQLFLGALGLQAQDTVTLDAQIEQALAAGNCRGKIGPGNSLMLQLGLAGQEQAVIQNNGATPFSSVDQQDVLVGRLQNQRAIAGILGLDGRFTGDTAAQGLAEQIADALDAGSRIHIAHGPLHGACLQGNVRLGHITDNLALTYIHFIAVVSDHSLARHDAQITRVLHYCEGAKLVDNIDIIVVSKVLDLVHGYYHLPKNGVRVIFSDTADIIAQHSCVMN